MTHLPEKLGFTTAYYDLPGLRMHAAVAGPAGGPLAVLLHGFPESWYSWRHQIGPLAEAGYRVVAPDQRGYNLTDKTPPYDARTLVDDIVHLLAACGNVPAYVAGHDWGANVAWLLSAAHPERVARLAILNVPHPIPMGRALRGGNLRQWLRSWYIFFFQIPAAPEWLLRQNDYARMRRMMLASSNPATFSAEDIEHYASAWAQPGALTAMIGWYRALWGRRRPARWTPHLRRIPAPTLIVWGERDAALGVELAEQSVQYLADGRLLRLPEATHWVHEDYPAEITRHLLSHFGG